MEITTLGNLMSLASQISGIDFSAADAKLSREAFAELVEDIFAKIDLLHKWNRKGKIGLITLSAEIEYFGPVLYVVSYTCKEVPLD